MLPIIPQAKNPTNVGLDVKNKSIYLEEYCRTMIAQEESDYIEMKKLLRDHKK